MFYMKSRLILLFFLSFGFSLNAAAYYIFAGGRPRTIPSNQQIDLEIAGQKKRDIIGLRSKLARLKSELLSSDLSRQPEAVRNLEQKIARLSESGGPTLEQLSDLEREKELDLKWEQEQKGEAESSMSFETTEAMKIGEHEELPLLSEEENRQRKERIEDRDETRARKGVRAKVTVKQYLTKKTKIKKANEMWNKGESNPIDPYWQEDAMGQARGAGWLPEEVTLFSEGVKQGLLEPEANLGAGAEIPEEEQKLELAQEEQKVDSENYFGGVGKSVEDKESAPLLQHGRNSTLPTPAPTSWLPNSSATTMPSWSRLQGGQYGLVPSQIGKLVFSDIPDIPLKDKVQRSWSRLRGGQYSLVPSQIGKLVFPDIPDTPDM